jgi:DNA invertase Pin-like site-specific DNA recombinase
LSHAYGAAEIEAVQRGLEGSRRRVRSHPKRPQILELRRQGKSITTIARQLGISRYAVARALKPR